MKNNVEEGCWRILNELKAESRALGNYPIPPKFFGPAAAKASKLFQDDNFQQYDSE